MLNKIENETNKIYQRQSWVKQGLDKLLTDMGEQMNLGEGRIVVRKGLNVCHKINYDTYEWYYLTYDNGNFFIEIDDPDYEKFTDDEKFDTVEIEELSPKVCRDIVRMIPKALKKILEELNEINDQYNEVENYLDKINKCFFN